MFIQKLYHLTNLNFICMASYKIALESEAKAIGGSTSSVTTNKCCTMARASELGCVANTGLYRSNQLVPKDHLSKKVTQYTITFKTISSSVSFLSFFNFRYTCKHRNALICIYGSRKYSYCYSHW